MILPWFILNLESTAPAEPVVSLLPPIHGHGRLVVRWTSTAPPGTVYELRVDGRLAWTGKSLEATIPAPLERVRVSVVVAGEAEEFDPAPATRARLSWVGGAYLDPSGAGDVAGFRIYGERRPGVGINYATAIGDLPIGGDGVFFDGYGYGGYGEGGYGFASSQYSWTSPVLSAGEWAFAVRPYDAAGNEGDPITTSVVIAAPPKPPAFDAARRRLTYTYDKASGTAKLKWLPSPE